MRRPRALEGGLRGRLGGDELLLPREIDALKLCLDLRREVLALGVGHLAAVEDGDDLPLAHPITETLAHLGHRADHPHRHPGHPVGIGRHRAGRGCAGEHAALRRRHRDRLGGDLLRGHPHVDLVPVFVVVVRFSLRGVSALFGRRRDGQAGGREAGAMRSVTGGSPAPATRPPPRRWLLGEMRMETCSARRRGRTGRCPRKRHEGRGPRAEGRGRIASGARGPGQEVRGDGGGAWAIRSNRRRGRTIGGTDRGRSRVPRCGSRNGYGRRCRDRPSAPRPPPGRPWPAWWAGIPDGDAGPRASPASGRATLRRGGARARGRRGSTTPSSPRTGYGAVPRSWGPYARNPGSRARDAVGRAVRIGTPARIARLDRSRSPWLFGTVGTRLRSSAG